jgi:hypothetical protein
VYHAIVLPDAPSSSSSLLSSRDQEKTSLLIPAKVNSIHQEKESGNENVKTPTRP